MKIAIITVFNSHNYGSFLQAHQLFLTLNKYGEVIFLNTHTRKLSKTFLRKSKKIINTSSSLKDWIKGTLFEFNEMTRLKNCWKSLPSTVNAEDINVLIMGSDEIWNITRSVCRHPIYWGAGLKAYKIAYAPSVNNADFSEFENHPEYIRYLNKIDCVSVRDKHSQNVVSCIRNERTPIVLDPTLLYEPEDVDFEYSKPYIAVYLFYGSMDSKLVDEIIDFAHAHDLALISAGQYISWCDFSIHSKKGNPFYIFKNASYVVTNTFHGTAYAINYNTNFVSYAKGKKKVEELLQQFELESRIAKVVGDLENILKHDIDYEIVEKKLAKLRRESMLYIGDSFEKAEAAVKEGGLESAK